MSVKHRNRFEFLLLFPLVFGNAFFYSVPQFYLSTFFVSVIIVFHSASEFTWWRSSVSFAFPSRRTRLYKVQMGCTLGDPVRPLPVCAQPAEGRGRFSLFNLTSCGNPPAFCERVSLDLVFLSFLKITYAFCLFSL